MFKEATYADLKQMFMNSVIMYDKCPVLVEHVTERRAFKGTDLLSGEDRVFSPEDPKFKHYGMNTGNINIYGEVIYFSRIPVRRWKQGLAVDNVKFLYDRDKFHDPDYRFCLEKVKRLNNKAVGKCIIKSYPSLAEALELVSEGENQIAFDRQFSVRSDECLMFKDMKVGKIDLDNGKILFQKKFEFLQDMLKV